MFHQNHNENLGLRNPTSDENSENSQPLYINNYKNGNVIIQHYNRTCNKMWKVRKGPEKEYHVVVVSVII